MIASTSTASATSTTIDMTGIDRLPNGKWRLRKRVNKKPICNKVFATLEDAIRVRDAIMRTLADEIMIPVDGMSLFHLGPRFLRSRINDRSYDDLVSRWNNHIKTTRFATMPLDAVTTPMIYEWLDDLKAKDTAPDNRPKKKLGWGTRRHCRNHLNAFFKWAVRLGHVSSNPCLGVIVEREDGDEDDQWSPNWYLDAEDQTKLFTLAKEFGKKEGSWVKFDAGTGLRGGEQWCLHLEDLHCVGDRPCTCVEKSDAPHIQVRFGSWDPDKGEYRSPKGRKGKRKDPRQVPLFGIALEAINEWLPYLARRKNRHGLLFPGPRGGRRTRPPKWFTRLAKAFPIPRLQGRRIWWHLLRHTCATALVNGWWGTKWALQEAQKILGHSSVKVTEQYAHLTAGAVQEMATKAQAAFTLARGCHAVVTTREKPRTVSQKRSPSKPDVVSSNLTGRATYQSPRASTDARWRLRDGGNAVVACAARRAWRATVPRSAFSVHPSPPASAEAGYSPGYTRPISGDSRQLGKLGAEWKPAEGIRRTG